MDQQLLYEETEAEVRSQEEKTSEIITEGRNLSSGESNSSSCFFVQVSVLVISLVYTNTGTGQHLYNLQSLLVPRSVCLCCSSVSEIMRQ